MTGLYPSGWNIRKLFAGSAIRPNSDDAPESRADEGVVQLIDSPRRSPVTPIEERLAAALKKAGRAVSVANLMKTVAADLYAEELHKGAGVLDIGLLGDRLFNRDIIRELKAGDGILWEIKQEREIL